MMMRAASPSLPFILLRHPKAPTTMAGPDRKESQMAARALSTVSKQYDFDGDGKLDEAEQAL